ncbi:Transposon Tf2-7 polyprotein [Rhizoctonia solani]|uniref:Transposon Tf2-7 polyprotein n=1 Tax=Rhizoctonia solani TaxID=456999 RepID=A0A0K6G8X7_9AGAM|nr:Transposon Tf2-7 polyprotein [Rhizoctonia solani]
MQAQMVSLQEQNQQLAEQNDKVAISIEEINNKQIKEQEALTLLKDQTQDIVDWLDSLQEPKTPPMGATYGPKATPHAASGATPHIHSPTPVRPRISVTFAQGLLHEKQPDSTVLLGATKCYQVSPIKVPKLSPSLHTPPAQAIPATPILAQSTTSPTTAPMAAKPPKMKEPDSFDGTRGRAAKQWWTRVTVWAAFQCPNYPAESALLLHILTLMKLGKAMDWVQPIIEKIVAQEASAPQTMLALTNLFNAAFSDPDASWATMRQLGQLHQTTDANTYTMEFNNLASDLDWSDKAALKAQYKQGLSFWVKSQLIQCDPYPATLAALQEAAIKINGIYQELNQSNPCQKAQGPADDKAKLTGGGKKKHEAMTLEVELANPGSGPTQEAFGTPKTTAKMKSFLICPIGRHKAILGKPWLTKENPQINWKTGVINYKTAKIANKEEADNHPIPAEYKEFAKVFGEEEFNQLPPHRPYNIDIELKDEAKLGHAPLYSMTPAESKELKEWLEKELHQGKITTSKSPIASPVMFVKKKDGSLRLVVDYQKLNEATKKNSYPLPRHDDLLAKIQGAKIFTKLDLCWGYNNIRVKEGDKWKMAFRTKYSLFETKVMPFRLTNAPAAFQHFMNDILQDLLDVTVIVYLDDILIFSKNPNKHQEHVREVLKRLQENQLFC